jgi:hypothetical protein
MKQKELHEEIHLGQLFRFVLNLQQKRLFTNKLEFLLKTSSLQSEGADQNSKKTAGERRVDHPPLQSIQELATPPCTMAPYSNQYRTAFH